MRKLLVVLTFLALVGSGCKYFRKEIEKKIDPVAIQKAITDSIERAKALITEAKLKQEREQARLDSIRRIEEQKAKFRFHVIIGSFKVPSNATSWEQEVHGFGFNNTEILEAPNGFHLVSIGAFDSYGKAFNEIDRINSENIDEPFELWIYENQ